MCGLSAIVIAAIALAQIPTVTDIFGILMVMTGIAIHKPPYDLQPTSLETARGTSRGT